MPKANLETTDQLTQTMTSFRKMLFAMVLLHSLATGLLAQSPTVVGDISPRTQILAVSIDPDRDGKTPVEFAGYQPLVEVEVDGKPAGWFLVATGWARTTIMPDAAQRMGLEVYDYSEVRDVPARGRELFNASTLAFGNVKVEVQGLWTEPGVQATTHASSPVSGIIGWDVLKSLSFTLDAFAGAMTIYDDEIPGDGSGREYSLSESWSQFPVVEVDGLGTHAIPLLLDTTVDAPIYVSVATFRELEAAPSKRIAVQAPSVATGKALPLATAYRSPAEWVPIIPEGTAIYVGERPAPLFRFGGVGLIGNGILGRSVVSIDRVRRVCRLSPPPAGAKSAVPGKLSGAAPEVARRIALTYLLPGAARATLSQIEKPSFSDLNPATAWIEDTAFAGAVSKLESLEVQELGDLINRCAGIDDVRGLEALLAWAKEREIDCAPGLRSGLIGASISGSVKVLEVISRELGSIQSVGADGFSALHYACSGGHPGAIRFCLDAKISPTAPGPGGLHPIELMGREGTAEAFDLMLARGATIRKPISGINIAVSAAENENAPLVRRAVEAGFDPNWTAGDDRVTPLMMAAYNGDTALVRFLLENGAEPATKDNNGDNALFYVARGTGSAATFEVLLKAGVPADTRSFEHGTLAQCIATYASPELLELALDAAGGTSDASPFGAPPVASAARRGHFELVKALVAAGFDPGREDSDGLTPLEWCAIGNHPGVAAFLLSQKGGARPDNRTIAKAIRLSARWGHDDAFILLAGAADEQGVRDLLDADRLLEDAVMGNNTRVLSLVSAKRLTVIPGQQESGRLADRARAVGAARTAELLAR